METSDAYASKRAILLELTAQGARVRGLVLSNVALVLRFTVAAFVGLGGLLLTVWRSICERQSVLPDAPLVVAIHGEYSTRTRHVLRALRDSCPDTPILIVGRPRVPLWRVQRILEEQGLGTAPLARPFDVRSLIGSASRSPACLVEGLRAVLTHTGYLTIGDLAAITYRILLGEAAASWHQRNGPKCKVVIYGHTGIGDTTLLELAQQRAGARTLHWVHGQALGREFIGYSNVGLFTCAYDAQRYERLGGYERSVACVAPRPMIRAQGTGLLILSNLIHPMNASYQKRRTQAELCLLELVARAASRVGIAPELITWKPHPVFYSQPESVQLEVEAKVATLGFSRWAGQTPEFDSFGIIASTPSTVAIETLRQGKLPIIVAIQDAEVQTAIAQFPLIVRSAEELTVAIATLSRSSEVERLFHQAWAAIGPAEALGFPAVAALADPVHLDAGKCWPNMRQIGPTNVCGIAGEKGSATAR